MVVGTQRRGSGEDRPTEMLTCTRRRQRRELEGGSSRDTYRYLLGTYRYLLRTSILCHAWQDEALLLLEHLNKFHSGQPSRIFDGKNQVYHLHPQIKMQVL
jgi:hypothetical protein